MKFIFIFVNLTLFSQTHSSTTDDSKVYLTMDKNNSGTKTYLTYSIRFNSFTDFKYIYKLPFNIYSGLTNLELRNDFKLRYYGISTYPFRYIISNKKNIDFSGAEGGSVKGDSSRGSYRIKLTLNPLYDDLKENINWYLFDLSMKSFSSDWGKLNKEDKKQFLNDISSLRISEFPVIERIIPDEADK
ncbi:MAG: hypothetical protein KA059_04425 [Elusimicrobiales bacterium]|nr:hypothetical protein [Elusimicrobiales bacterium]